MRDVGIYPIYRGDEPGMDASFKGCLDHNAYQEHEMDAHVSFIDAIRKFCAENGDFDAGHYLLIEFDDDIDTYRGQVFTVREDGGIEQGLLDPLPSVPRFTTWPPKQ